MTERFPLSPERLKEIRRKVQVGMDSPHFGGAAPGGFEMAARDLLAEVDRCHAEIRDWKADAISSPLEGGK